MSHHRDNNQRIHPVQPEVVDNPNANGPSPSGMAMGLAVQGKFPALMGTFEAQMNALYSRAETAVDQVTKATTARVVLLEQMAQESSCRYEELVKTVRKMGS